MLTGFWRHCRLALRVLAHHWRLTLAMVVTIAIAIGAATTAMSFVSPILLRTLPFRDADRLYRIEPSDATGQPLSISVPTFVDWQAGVRRARLAAYTMLDFNVFGGGAPESILAARVTPSFFATMGVPLSLGRTFADDEHRSGGLHAVILTHQFWQRRYGGDRAIVGRTIELSGPSFLADASGHHRVIGVLAPEFWLFYKDLDVVVPLRVSPEQMARRDRPAIETVLARLEPGATPDALNSELAGVVRDVSTRHGAAEPVRYAAASQAQAAHFRAYRPRLVLVLVLAVLMFVLAVLNVAALLIALAVTRLREFSVRAALGASRLLLFRQTLIEGTLLGVAGGAAGLLVGHVANAIFRAYVPGPLLSLLPGEAAAIRIDASVVALIGGAVVVVALLSALITFVATGGVRGASTLRAAARGTTDSPKYGGLRTSTIAAQLVLAAALVVTTGTLSASLVRLRAVDLGVNTDRLVSVWINVDPRRYGTAAERSSLFDRVVDGVNGVAGVQAVSAIDHPITQDRGRIRVAADGSVIGDAATYVAFQRAVSPRYFRTIEVRLLAGRDFDARDAANAQPVAIVSRALAEQLWPQRSAIGRQIRAGSGDSTGPWLTVVGVTADVRRTPHEPPMAVVYRPLRQDPPAWLYVMVRTTRETADIASTIGRAVLAIDARQPVEGPYIMDEWVSDMTAPLRFVVLVGLSFSLLAVVLAFAGVYALTADLSRRATREIGIRKALGATTRQIIDVYMWRSARSAIPALIAGAMAGMAVVRTLAGRFEGVDSSPLWVAIVVIAFFAGLVLVSTYLASRSAAAADPARAMHVE